MGRYTATVQDHLILPARVRQTEGQEQAYRLLGRAVPAPVPVRLVIDTGSKRSALIPGLVDRLELALTGKARIETSQTSVEASLFWVRLEFPEAGLKSLPQVLIARLPLPSSLATFHGLIGRDVLRAWEYLYFEGRRGRMTIRDVLGGLFGWLRREQL
jgi:hypothetical protein